MMHSLAYEIELNSNVRRSALAAVNNTAPVAMPDHYSTRPNTLLDIAAPGFLLNDTDADGDALHATSISVIGTCDRSSSG